MTVGTDHHPFDRLITWVNGWLDQHPGQAGRFFVQWGTASVRPACSGSPFLTTGELDALLDDASVVVCHGGPASMAGAWARGIVPVVVPRQARLGEHVDDHQVHFSSKVAEMGRIRLAPTPAAFARQLAGAELAAQAGERPQPQRLGAAAELAVARFGDLVEALVSTRPRRRLLPRRAAVQQSSAPAGTSPGHTRLSKEEH